MAGVIDVEISSASTGIELDRNTIQHIKIRITLPLNVK
jgi:hypothetical protein